MRPLLFFLLVLSFVACRQNGPDPRIAEALEAARQELAPDRRVVWWQLDVRQQGKTVTLRGETSHPEAARLLTQKLEAAGYRVQDSLRLLPDSSVNGKVFGLVNLSVCNIRSRPKHSAELATQALLGTPLRVYKRQGDWWLVQTPDDYFGWLDADGFTPLTPEAFRQWQRADRIVCVADYDYAYVRPDRASAKISDLAAGNILALRGTSEGWAQVAFPDGREGFVPPGSWLPFGKWLATRNPTPENILATARELMGRPYLWGGTSPRAMDCSGFTKTVFFLNGLVLARDASQQVHTGLPVQGDTSTWAGFQPADLLFFGRPATDSLPERIWHVAIHTGAGRLIHAAGRVREESLNPADPDFNAERRRTFVRARRILGSEGRNGIQRVADMALYTGEKGEMQ